MAEEDEKVVVAKTGNNNNLLVMVGVALIVVSLAMTVVSLMTVMSINKKLEAPEEITSIDPTAIPLSEIVIFNFTSDFVFTFQDVENDVTHNVTMKIAVGLHNTEKDYSDVETTMKESETIIRAGVESLVEREGYMAFESEESKEALKEQLKVYLNDRMTTQTVVDVYFNNLLTSTR